MSNFDKLNRFATTPVYMDMNRSKFNLSHSHKTTFDSGKLIPLSVMEVLPDDTFKIGISSVVRSITPAVPVMDNAYMDLFVFWVPARLCTVHEKDWQKLHGEVTNGYWAPASESTLSNTGNTFKVTNSTYAVQVQSLAHYMKCAPLGFYHNDMELSRLPFNGYWEIWNNWFRDQNTQAPIDWKSFNNATMAQSACYGTATTGNKVMNVNRMMDYFQGVLPEPQKGNSVLLPLSGEAPVITGDVHIGYQTTYPQLQLVNNAASGSGGTNNCYALYAKSINSGGRDFVLNKATTNTSSSSVSTGETYLPSNLWADLNQVSSSTINQLRQGFAIQKLLEKDARGGSMFRQMLKVHFNVSIPDNTVQVPEYLGGKRIPLNNMQVVQTTEGTNDPLGHVGAFSNTADSSYICTKSFSEHGYLYFLGCIRPLQSYCQGVSKMFTRNRRYDFYYPVFANLGEMAVKETEIYANNSSNLDEVFGYQEAWAEYRYIPSQVSGYMAYNSGDNIAQQWTYCNRFASKPVLNSSFRVQDKSQIGNTFVSNTANYQYIGDFFFDVKAWRPMPYFSIPGLIDHH
ncbi:MAG: hypothetical protein K6E24_04255 [bacterium]|nr:hypothetical protein [bacterium]